MITITDKSACSGCSACAVACPVHCIEMVADDEGFDYPIVDEAKCTGCGLCDRVCVPAPARPDAVETAAFAAKSKSDEIRRCSSSGGVFTALAERTLNGGGAVYGAAVGKNGVVEHIRVTSPEELARLRGSKYVQSRMGGIYARVREDLQNGLPVYFSGTPCQVGGLRNYLPKHHPGQLVCQDLICHGVPSRKVWRKHLAELGFSGEEDIAVSFRDKTDGWTDFSMRISQGERVYRRRFGEDAYGRAFLSNIILRPSCHRCHYKQMRYRGDLTLADFWGVQEVLPDFFDRKGVSLVLVHTETGKKAFDEILPALEWKNVPLAPAIQGNRSPINGISPHPNRDRLLRRLDQKPFAELVGRYCNQSLVRRTIRYAKRKLTALWDRTAGRGG